MDDVTAYFAICTDVVAYNVSLAACAQFHNAPTTRICDRRCGMWRSSRSRKAARLNCQWKHMGIQMHYFIFNNWPDRWLQKIQIAIIFYAIASSLLLVWLCACMHSPFVRVHFCVAISIQSVPVFACVQCAVYSACVDIACLARSENSINYFIEATMPRSISIL